MAKLIKDGHTVETELATEIATLRSHGYKPAATPFDAGGTLSSGVSVVTNTTDRPEVVKPVSKSTK